MWILVPTHKEFISFKALRAILVGLYSGVPVIASYFQLPEVFRSVKLSFTTAGATYNQNYPDIAQSTALAPIVWYFVACLRCNLDCGVILHLCMLPLLKFRKALTTWPAGSERAT